MECPTFRALTLWQRPLLSQLLCFQTFCVSSELRSLPFFLANLHFFCGCFSLCAVFCAFPCHYPPRLAGRSCCFSVKHSYFTFFSHSSRPGASQYGIMFAGVLPTWLAEPGQRTIAYENMWGDKVACIIISAELGFHRRLSSLFPILNARLSLAVIFSPSRFTSALVAANYVSSPLTAYPSLAPFIVVKC